MSSGIVRNIKRFDSTQVANAMYFMGYRWDNPKRRPTNIERMVEGLSRVELVQLLDYLEEHSAWRKR